MAIRVLIVDDSVSARNIISSILTTDKRIEVVGMASDAYEARDLVVSLRPDVICLDINMPRMDGVTFLKKLMKYIPTPVIMVSSLTKKSANITLEALEAGAIDYVQKPKHNIFNKKSIEAKRLLEKVIFAAKSKIFFQDISFTNKVQTIIDQSDKVIFIGSSTGGVDALKVILSALPKQMPPILVVQHMPQVFIPSLVGRLEGICALHVKIAQNDEELKHGSVYISPGGYHMVIRKRVKKYFIEIGQGKNVNGHCPSADILFYSAAKILNEKAIGVILTGMGVDGAKGMLKMHENGAKTIAQSEKTCVVYGMPKEAVKFGGVDTIADLKNIPSEILKVL
jgi:two-component system, chemotaxis family, protein-glutamate methylesterase/glutaminase